MTLIEQLFSVAKEQNQDAELPDTILARILNLPATTDLSGKEELIQKLIEQLKIFDLYSGSGCFDESCGIQNINNTLERFTKK
jgi:hypothetical protein